MILSQYSMPSNCQNLAPPQHFFVSGTSIGNLVASRFANIDGASYVAAISTGTAGTLVFAQICADQGSANDTKDGKQSDNPYNDNYFHGLPSFLDRYISGSVLAALTVTLAAFSPSLWAVQASIIDTARTLFFVGHGKILLILYLLYIMRNGKK